jgi:zinc D-Ala-D-Ala carboxypeptidase
MNNIKISDNFSLHEFQCKDGSQLVKIDERLLVLLQTLRDKVKKPIEIVSAYRTPEYNKKIGGAPKSQHVEGKAVDIKIKGITPKEVAKLAEEVGFDGIGIYPTFTHCDTRGTKARWNEGIE